MRFGSLTPLSFAECTPAQTDSREAVFVAGAWSNGGISERQKTQVKRLHRWHDTTQSECSEGKRGRENEEGSG